MVMTQERLQDLLQYDKNTGKLFWRQSRGTKKAGSEAGSVNGKGYVCIMIDGSGYQAHRIAWSLHYQEMPSQDIDHINGIKTDNRICNLRQNDRWCWNPICVLFGRLQKPRWRRFSLIGEYSSF